MTARQGSGANVLNNVILDCDVTAALDIDRFLDKVVKIVILNQDVRACRDIDGDIAHGINRIINAAPKSPGLGHQAPVIHPIGLAVEFKAFNDGVTTGHNQTVG